MSACTNVVIVVGIPTVWYGVHAKCVLPFVATENHQHVEHGHALMDLDDVSSSIRWERTPSLP